MKNLKKLSILSIAGAILAEAVLAPTQPIAKADETVLPYVSVFYTEPTGSTAMLGKTHITTYENVKTSQGAVCNILETVAYYCPPLRGPENEEKLDGVRACLDSFATSNPGKPANMVLDTDTGIYSISDFPHVQLEISRGDVIYAQKDFNGAAGREAISRGIMDKVAEFTSNDHLVTISERLGHAMNYHLENYPGYLMKMEIDFHNDMDDDSVFIRPPEKWKHTGYDGPRMYWEAKRGRSEHDFPYVSFSSQIFGSYVRGMSFSRSHEEAYAPQNREEALEYAIDFLWEKSEMHRLYIPLECEDYQEEERVAKQQFIAHYGEVIRTALNAQIDAAQAGHEQVGLGFIIDNRKPAGQQLTITDYLWS
jgi:hypothetical protein